jgi:hypothetical protein
MLVQLQHAARCASYTNTSGEEVEDRVKVAEEATKLGWEDESDALSGTMGLGGKEDHITKKKILRGSVSKR